ncbi:MAG: DUF6285 domain-containing protein [Gammaproteobacteria bacterium]
MPLDQPELSELVVAVREHLDALVQKLDGQDRYETLVSVYLLDVISRELSAWQPQSGDDERRLRQLLKEGGGVDDAELTHRLSAELRGGLHDDRLGEMLEPLLEHVRAKVMVSRPDLLDID